MGFERDPAKRPTANQILKEPLVAQARSSMLTEVRACMETPTSATAMCRPYADTAGTYSKDDEVEYKSVSHNAWLLCIVTAVDSEGRVMLSIKPNVWVSVDLQGERVRPKPNDSPSSHAYCQGDLNQGNDFQL